MAVRIDQAAIHDQHLGARHPAGLLRHQGEGRVHQHGHEQQGRPEHGPGQAPQGDDPLQVDGHRHEQQPAQRRRRPRLGQEQLAPALVVYPVTT